MNSLQLVLIFLGLTLPWVLGFACAVYFVGSRCSSAVQLMVVFGILGAFIAAALS